MNNQIKTSYKSMDSLDRFNRPLKDFRISITNKCNLNCIYCHHEGIHNKINGLDDIELTPEEIAFIVEVSTEFGIQNIKLTGGEPLLRNDIYEIIKKISKIKGIKDISLVSNGTLLKDSAKKLAEAGLNRLNVSLDTLNETLYQKIINTNNKYSPNDIIEGIKLSLKHLEKRTF